MLMPKRVKFRKQHRGRRAGMATRGNKLDFGDFGMVAMEAGWITSRQIEAARMNMTRAIKRGGKVWIRIFPDKPYTKKPLETRMGKGKGPVEGWVAVVKPGRVMFEMDGVPMALAKEAMRLAAHKMPIRCKFVVKAGVEPAHGASSHSEEELIVFPAKITSHGHAAAEELVEDVQPEVFVAEAPAEEANEAEMSPVEAEAEAQSEESSE